MKKIQEILIFKKAKFLQERYMSLRMILGDSRTITLLLSDCVEMNKRL